MSQPNAAMMIERFLKNIWVPFGIWVFEGDNSAKLLTYKVDRKHHLQAVFSLAGSIVQAQPSIVPAHYNQGVNIIRID